MGHNLQFPRGSVAMQVMRCDLAESISERMLDYPQADELMSYTELQANMAALREVVATLNFAEVQLILALRAVRFQRDRAQWIGDDAWERLVDVLDCPRAFVSKRPRKTP